MSNVASERVVNGVKTRVLHGKDYVEVAERVRLVHSQKHEFEVMESVPFPVAERLVWRCIIKFDGKQYIGSAEVKLSAPKNTPDGTNPFECAETSAIGRALAFAGLGTVESIASFDEVMRSQPGVTVIEAAHTPQLPPAQEASYYKIYERGKAKKLWIDGSGFCAFATAELGVTVTKENVKSLGTDLLLQLDKAVEQEQAA